MRRDIGTDDPRVRVRPGKGSRPRTKIRPDYSDAPIAEVVGIDRGRYRLLLERNAEAPPEGGGVEGESEPAGRERVGGAETPPEGEGEAGDGGAEYSQAPEDRPGAGIALTAVKARELGRGTVAVGDRVRVTGDVSGRKDTLARLVRVEERTSELRRSSEEGEGRERVIVANADQLAIVVALAQPDPRPGMIDRCLVAAYDAGMVPLLILTKADLADPAELLTIYEPLGIDAYVCGLGPAAEETALPRAEAGSQDGPVQVGLTRIRRALVGHETVLVGHSGVGKSTLINALVPDADRTTGHVNEVTGKGRHTSTSAVSLALPGGGRIIDTPGVRSFGLAHVSPDSVLRGFVDLAELAVGCPRGCRHAQIEPECALGEATDPHTVARVASFRRLLAAQTDDWSH